MFLKRFLCFLVALGCFLGIAITAAAAEVESGASYCFSAEDFSPEETLTVSVSQTFPGKRVSCVWVPGSCSQGIF